jgi:MFS family permease
MTSSLRQGWFVLAAGMVGIFMTTPGQTVGVSGFVDHVAADLGLARERVLVLYGLGTLTGILPAPFIGRLVDRFGPRRVIGFAVVALGLSCAALASAQGPVSLALGFTLLRGTAIGGLALVNGHMINLWFDRFRGRANAIAMMGLALGGLVVPAAAEQLTLAYGWRSAYLALGVGVLAIMLPVGLVFFRNRPQSYGLMPDFGRTTAARAALLDQGLALSAASRTLMFWYLLSIAILANAIGTALLLDHIRALEAAGLTRALAISLLGVVTVTQAVCVLGGGVLVDRYGTQRVGMLGLLLLAASVTSAMTASGLVASAAYAAALGAGLGVLHVVQGAGLAEHFGTRHLGNLRGTASLLGIFGAASGPLPLAWWSPETSYVIFLAATAAALGLGVAAVPRPLERLAAVRP